MFLIKSKKKKQNVERNGCSHVFAWILWCYHSFTCICIYGLITYPFFRKNIEYAWCRMHCIPSTSKWCRMHGDDCSFEKIYIFDPMMWFNVLRVLTTSLSSKCLTKITLYMFWKYKKIKFVHEHCKLARGLSKCIVYI